MTDTAIDTPKSALLDAPGKGKKTQTPMIVQVARHFGVSPLRQMRDILSMRGGVQKLNGPEYYALRLFDPAIAARDKRAFLGQAGINALNTGMNPPETVPTSAFVGNKLLYTKLLAQLGLDTTDTQILASTHKIAGRMRTASDATALAQFLRTDARYPLFGKPYFGSLSTGAVRIQTRQGDTLTLFDGSTHKIDAFARDVFTHYGGGYMMQTALSPHRQMGDIAGPAIGCVRVVTANDGTGPVPVYAVWKMPARDAISDNTWQNGVLLAQIDMASGVLVGFVRGDGMTTERSTHHPVSGKAVVGQILPYWQETVRMAVDAHAIFSEFGVFGFDIAVTDDGPKILEANDNPSHMMYQRAAARGINNDDFAPVWQRVIARQKQQLARLRAAGAKPR